MLLIAACTLTAASCEPTADEVGTDTVRVGTVAEVVDVPAAVTARAVATLTAPDSGRLARLTVGPGAKVKAGTVIAVIDAPAARKRLTDATTALAAASGAAGGVRGVNLAGSQRRVDKAAEEAFTAARAATAKVGDPAVRAALVAHVTAAERQYEAAAATSRRLVGQVQRGIADVSRAVSALGAAQRAQAQAAYDLAGAAVQALTLRAPISGVVQPGGPAGGAGGSSLTDLISAATGGSGAAPTGPVAAGAGSAPVAGVDDQLAQGDLVTAGTAIVTIVDVSQLGLAGEVDETDVLLVRPGVAAAVELDAAPGAVYRATVRSVDLLPTASSRGGVAYRLRLSLDGGEAADGAGPAPTPRPGMTAVAHLRVRDAPDAITVPAAAVFRAEGGDAVWLITDGKAVRQPVTVGVQGEDLVQVTNGLRAGQRVVVRGTDKVKQGMGLPR